MNCNLRNNEDNVIEHNIWNQTLLTSHFSISYVLLIVPKYKRGDCYSLTITGLVIGFTFSFWSSWEKLEGTAQTSIFESKRETIKWKEVSTFISTGLCWCLVYLYQWDDLTHYIFSMFFQVVILRRTVSCGLHAQSSTTFACAYCLISAIWWLLQVCHEHSAELKSKFPIYFEALGMNWWQIVLAAVLILQKCIYIWTIFS